LRTPSRRSAARSTRTQARFLTWPRSTSRFSLMIAKAIQEPIGQKPHRYWRRRQLAHAHGIVLVRAEIVLRAVLWPRIVASANPEHVHSRPIGVVGEPRAGSTAISRSLRRGTGN